MAHQFVLINLVDHINNALRESKFPARKNGYFASKNALEVITKPSVTRTIWSNSKSFRTLVDSDRELVEFITGQAREIFAIGIYMDIHNQGLRNMMRLFMLHRKSDRNLPMSDAEMETMWPGVQYRSRRRSFKDSQHIFRPQDFPMRERFSVIQLRPNVVLPILESKQMCEGRFGIVYRVRLHGDFLDFNDPIRKVRQNEQ